MLVNYCCVQVTAAKPVVSRHREWVYLKALFQSARLNFDDRNITGSSAKIKDDTA